MFDDDLYESSPIWTWFDEDAEATFPNGLPWALALVASYSGSPWHGTASGGYSATRNATEATNAPTTGTAVNGLTPASFASSTQLRLVVDGLVSDHWTDAVSFAFVVKPAALPAPATFGYDDPHLVGDTNGVWGLSLSSSGVRFYWSDLTGTYFETPFVSLSVGSRACVLARFTGAGIQIRVNGGAWTTIVSCLSLLASEVNNEFTLGTGYTLGAAPFLDGDMFEARLGGFAISDTDADAFWTYANARYSIASVSYTLTADAATFVETGASAALLLGHSVAASAGSFTETGTAASLLAARTVAASAGALTETGTAAGLLIGHVVAADAASFAETGTAATLLAGRAITADAGAYVETGAAAALVAARTISTSAGALALSGSDAGVLRGYPLTAAAGACSLLADDAALLAARYVSTASGTFTFDGVDVGLSRIRLLLAEASTYDVGGTDPTLYKGALRRLEADAGELAASGAPASLGTGWISNVFNDLPASHVTIDEI